MVAPSPIQGLPGYVPIADKGGLPTQIWYSFFLALYKSIGGGGTGTITVSGANFAPTTANNVFAGPASGTAARPDFRPLATTDLQSVAGFMPGITGNTPAGIGIVGEFEEGIATSVALTSTTIIDITSVVLGAGDWDVWATFGTTPAGGASQTLIKAWISSTSATDPGAFNGGAYLSRGITGGEAAAQVVPVGTLQFSSATGGQVFLSAAVTFAGGTMAGGGIIAARRRR